MRALKLGGVLSAVVLAASILSHPPAGAVHALIERSSYCDGTGQVSAGEGSMTQLGVHFDIFIPEYGARCPSGAGLVNFLGTGDSAAVRGMLMRTRPFTGSDLALSLAEKRQIENDTAGLQFRNSVIHQVPLYVDGWAVAYNLGCTSAQLKLRSEVLSLIYTRVITQWNHPALVVDNPTLASCAGEGIKLTKRSDPAGATVIFKDYLSKRNAVWQPYKLAGLSSQWPTSGFACSGLGEEGMAGCIASNPGALGYVETRVAIANGLKLAAVENASKAFVAPSPDNCSKAASAAPIPPGTPGVDVRNPMPGIGPDSVNVPPASATMGDWSGVTLTDAREGYPICAFSYAFVLQSWVAGYKSQVSAGVTRTTVDFLWTALSESAQSKLPGLQLTRLPSNVLQVSRDGIESIRFCGC